MRKTKRKDMREAIQDTIGHPPPFPDPNNLAHGLRNCVNSTLADKLIEDTHNTEYLKHAEVVVAVVKLCHGSC
eukprot:4275919-Pyramimonas_sp.AAC.1